jgi:DNA-binding MarR family transcriptional regulator
MIRLITAVEVVRLYSNLSQSVRMLLGLRNRAGSTLRLASTAPTRRAQHKLNHAQTADLLMAYREGATAKDLAIRFALHRTTVTALLRRYGVEPRHH